MGLELTAITALGGLALGAVGQGISYFAQQEAAKTQAVYARLNAQSQMAQAQMQSKLATAQASLQSQQSKNAQVAAEQQANALRSQAEQEAASARINISRNQEDQKRFRAMLIARGGASGTVVGEGSQFDALLNATDLQTLENSEMAYQTELTRRGLYRQAEAAALGAGNAGIQSGLDLLSGEAAASRYRQAGTQAQLQGMAAATAARGASLGALGGAISGFGNLGLRAFELDRLGAFRFS